MISLGDVLSNMLFLKDVLNVFIDFLRHHFHSHAATFFWRDARQNSGEFRQRNLRAKLKQTIPAHYRVVQSKATFGRFGDSFSRSRWAQSFGVLEWMMDVSSRFFDGRNIDLLCCFQRGAHNKSIWAVGDRITLQAIPKNQEPAYPELPGSPLHSFYPEGPMTKGLLRINRR